MTAAFAIVLLARQAAPAPPPAFPVGTSPEFAKAAMAVEARLVEGDLPGAREAVRALPIRDPRFAWADDATLPPALRSARAAGLAEALKRWNTMAKDFAPRVVDGAADVTVAFAPVLPEGPDGMPLPVREDARVPFRATVGLSLGKPAVPLRPEEMNMAVAYALGRYLGVPDSPLPGSAMHPESHPGVPMTFWPRPDDWALAARNLAFADRLRAAVAAGKPLGIAPPSVHLVKERLDLGTIDQGKPLWGAIEAENRGAGPLDYSVIRDCDCFDPISDGQVPARGQKSVGFRIKTLQYTGRVEKLLLFQSNDPERPTVEVPVTFVSRPAYRLVHPGGDRVNVPATGGAYDLFFFTPPGSPLHATAFHWDGVEAKVTWEPWSGTLADVEMGEGPLPRTGWRFHIRVSGGLPPGRPTGTLSVNTDSRLFPVALGTLTFQKGIVASDVFLGDLASGSKGSFLVDRPNAPFRITSVDAGPHLKATVVDRRGGWEYLVSLEYKGPAPKGDFMTPVRVHTNDPKQRTIEILATGYVK